MEKQQEAMLKSLVAIAWADGHFAEEEAEIIEAMLSTFAISGEAAEWVRRYASSPRSLDDLPVADLSADDRRTLLSHAVILSYIDGDQDESERKVLSELVDRLEVDRAEAEALMAEADERARKLIDILG